MKEAFREIDEVFKLTNAHDGFHFLDVGYVENIPGVYSA